MTDKPLLRLGTRGSPLALRQTEEAKARLAAAHPDLARPGAITVTVIRTTGDTITDRSLADIGGKGLFVKELDDALLEDRIDAAVHSVKDIPTWLADGIALACLLTREDPRDVFLSNKAETLAGLAAGSRVGTSSLRRQSQILARYPSLVVVPLRGNVETRIAKLDRGEVDATILALAGLKRLGRTEAAASVIEPDDMLPAAGQGALGIACRAGDARVEALLAPLADPATTAAVTAERAALDVLGGSCRTPIGAFAELRSGGRLRLRALVASADGKTVHSAEAEGPTSEARAIGRRVGQDIVARAGRAFIDALG